MMTERADGCTPAEKLLLQPHRVNTDPGSRDYFIPLTRPERWIQAEEEVVQLVSHTHTHNAILTAHAPSYGEGSVCRGSWWGDRVTEDFEDTKGWP